MLRFKGLVRVVTLATCSAIFFGATSSFATSLTIESLGSANQTLGNEFHLGVNVGSSGVSDAPNAAFTHYDTQVLTPAHPAWAGPIGSSKWTSFSSEYSPTKTQAHDGEVIENNDFVWFFLVFDLADTQYSGTLNVFADDTASVWINGNQLATANAPYSPNGPHYPTCSETGIGCLNSTMGVFSTFGDYLFQGTNVLAIQVFQRNGTGFGVDYSGHISAVPEPFTALLLGAGLLGVPSARRRVANKK